mgnify:CR=1 FL=1
MFPTQSFSNPEIQSISKSFHDYLLIIKSIRSPQNTTATSPLTAFLGTTLSDVQTSVKTPVKPQNLELKEYLRALFRPGDTVNFVVSSFEKDGKFLPSGKGVNKSFEELIKACNTYEDIGYILGDWNPKAGAWARINPMSGEGCKNSDVEEFRHCLIESDSLPKEKQLRKIRELNLPCSALVDSGGKSIHAIVKIDAGKDEKLYRERVSKLHEFLAKNGFPVDKACKNASRLSRIAAVTRDGKRQRLIAVNIGMPSYQQWQDNWELLDIRSNTIDDFLNCSIYHSYIGTFRN